VPENQEHEFDYGGSQIDCETLRMEYYGALRNIGRLNEYIKSYESNPMPHTEEIKNNLKANRETLIMYAQAILLEARRQDCPWAE
jgi:hypothetical protein